MSSFVSMGRAVMSRAKTASTTEQSSFVVVSTNFHGWSTDKHNGNFLKVRVCVKQTSSHVWRHPGWKACHRTEGARNANRSNGGNITHFLTASPQRHSWCCCTSCLSCKSDSSRKMIRKTKRVYFTLPVVFVVSVASPVNSWVKC